MSIQADAQAQVIAAMKSHDDKRRDALRLIVNALKTESKEKLHDLSSDEEIAAKPLKIITKWELPIARKKKRSSWRSSRDSSPNSFLQTKFGI